MKFTMLLLLLIIYLIRRVVGESYSYDCTGSNSSISDNIHFKCIKKLCNGSSCETIINYLDKPGPDVIIDINNKVLLNLEIENISTIHVLFINNVRDSVNSNFTMYRLLKPIILKVQLAGPRELYKLRFINYVNGGPTEEVISKVTRQNYFGCDSGDINPTCGIQYYGLNKAVPFSKGFCCSCINSVNDARQQRSSEVVNKNNISITSNCNDVVTTQPRGEQDCKNISESPAYANSYTYHESAHCFRYSDLWFNVYKVEKSETVLPLTMELFKKSESSVYMLHQQCLSSSLSSNSKLTIFKNLVSHRLEVVKGLNETMDNNLMAMFVLIPQNVPKTYQYSLPSHLNDQRAGKFLVIHPSRMSKNGGAECDKIGVEPRAFYEQSDRCYRPRSSCLREQPIELMQQRERDCDGEPSAGAANGRLFIEDYVKGDISFDDVTDHIIVYLQPSSFAAETPMSVQSVSEVRLDDNGVVSNKILLQISEIHAIFDNECNNTANLFIFVTNLSLKTAEFFIETSGSTDSKKIEKKRGQAIVHPQQTERFFLKFECPIKTKDCVASVQLYAENAAATAVASRKFKAVRGSGCYCLWHRRCKCYQTESPCTAGGTLLSQAQYAAAGFLGDVPRPPRTAFVVVERDEEAAVVDHDELIVSLLVLVGLLAAALVLGLLKAVSPYRAHWLWIIFGDRRLDAYLEPELNASPVVRDERGRCVHPATASRNVRLLDRGREFVANSLFFVCLLAAAAYRCEFFAGCSPDGDRCGVADRERRSSSCNYTAQQSETACLLGECRDDRDSPRQSVVCSDLRQLSECFEYNTSDESTVDGRTTSPARVAATTTPLHLQ
ncbi:uncharacterized protein LOC114120494 [Aphis gossypii]|uniref:Generative cell specific-1/HAP2 domain-containing protein n=1 Tax=Aphis gossypii TaxID=80765 RepID=A0A9P0NK35_APHGO|nr:uncharacterized protein LOC114120494 [Aphis gossypii]CAH1724781.1 unnamed protein product [Aphis gossypii]